MTEPARQNDHGVPIPSGFVKPSWLRSPDHEKWAAAMMECQDPQARCGGDGFCHQHNWCFSIFRARYDRLMAVRAEIDQRIRRLMDSVDGEL